MIRELGNEGVFYLFTVKIFLVRNGDG